MHDKRPFMRRANYTEARVQSKRLSLFHFICASHYFRDFVVVLYFEKGCNYYRYHLPDSMFNTSCGYKENVREIC